MSLSPALLKLIKDSKNKYARAGGKALKLKEGRTTVRILQASADAKFWADQGVHWIKTEKNGKPVAVVGCHDHVYNQPCPICTAIDSAAKSATDDESLSIIKDWQKKKTILVNALIRSGADAKEEPQILELTPTTFSDILSTIELYAEEYGNVLDPKTGLDFIVERNGKGLDTKYTVMPSPKSKPVPDAALKQLEDLEAYIEKEFFRGEETKALSHIAAMTGIDVPRVGSSKKAGLLTGPTAVAAEPVDDMNLKAAPKAAASEKPAVAALAATAEVVAAPATPSGPATAEVEFGGQLGDDEVDKMLADLENLGS